MKEDYFTFESIDGISRRILDEARRLGGERDVAFVPESSALLVIDMQRYFLDPNSHAYIASASPVVPRIRALIGAYGSRGLTTVFTRHLNSGENAGMLSSWWGDLISGDDESSEITGDLVPAGSVVVEKTQYDAFFRTGLEKILADAGVSQVVVTGVMTHLCCETTARSAFVRGFTVFFPVDGTATYNEDFHRAACINLSHGFAVPVLVGDLIADL